MPGFFDVLLRSSITFLRVCRHNSGRSFESLGNDGTYNRCNSVLQQPYRHSENKGCPSVHLQIFECIACMNAGNVKVFIFRKIILIVILLSKHRGEKAKKILRTNSIRIQSDHEIGRPSASGKRIFCFHL